MYLLDTNHCTFIFIQKDLNVLNHLMNLPEDSEIFINSIIYGELILMAEKSERRRENLNKVEEFVKAFTEFIYPIDKETSKIYGELYASIFNFFAPKDKAKRRKFKIEDAGVRQNDLWIACTAIQHNLTIVSEDSDFQIISQARQLNVECWKTT